MVVHSAEYVGEVVLRALRTGEERIVTTESPRPGVCATTAIKVLAAARERSESQVVEDALRAYLRTSQSEAARADLRALMDRLAQRGRPR
jgi:hypothetical protein